MSRKTGGHGSSHGTMESLSPCWFAYLTMPGLKRKIYTPVRESQHPGLLSLVANAIPNWSTALAHFSSHCPPEHLCSLFSAILSNLLQTTPSSLAISCPRALVTDQPLHLLIALVKFSFVHLLNYYVVRVWWQRPWLMHLYLAFHRILALSRTWFPLSCLPLITFFAIKFTNSSVSASNI